MLGIGREKEEDHCVGKVRVLFLLCLLWSWKWHWAKKFYNQSSFQMFNQDIFKLAKTHYLQPRQFPKTHANSVHFSTLSWLLRPQVKLNTRSHKSIPPFTIIRDSIPLKPRQAYFHKIIIRRISNIKLEQLRPFSPTSETRHRKKNSEARKQFSPEFSRPEPWWKANFFNHTFALALTLIIKPKKKTRMN